MATSLPRLPEWQQISTNVIRILGGNPGKVSCLLFRPSSLPWGPIRLSLEMRADSDRSSLCKVRQYRLQHPSAPGCACCPLLTAGSAGTNTYLLGRGPKRILLDTGQGEKAWASTLEEVLKAQPNGASVSTCLLSHWHHDHVGGVKDLQKICPDAKVYKNTPGLNPDGILDLETVLDIDDGQRFRVREGADDETFEVEAVHCPGHAKDHMAFLVTASSDESEIGAIFTADNVLGHGTAVFEDLGTYLESLALMKQRAGEGKRAYPGHGAVIEDARVKIDEYLQHRKLREEEAHNVLRFGTVTRPPDTDTQLEKEEWGSMEMVKVIYKEYPENLHQPAEWGLVMVLEKLRKDGRVVKTAGGKWRVNEKAIL